jgi:hypothetical protein
MHRAGSWLSGYQRLTPARLAGCREMTRRTLRFRRFGRGKKQRDAARRRAHGDVARCGGSPGSVWDTLGQCSGSAGDILSALPAAGDPLETRCSYRRLRGGTRSAVLRRRLRLQGWTSHGLPVTACGRGSRLPQPRPASVGRSRSAGETFTSYLDRTGAAVDDRAARTRAHVLDVVLLAGQRPLFEGEQDD